MEYVVAFTGPRGAGKTISMTFLALRDLLAGREVLANFEIEKDGYRSKPLMLEDWVSLPESLQGALICIDEIQLWADSRRSMALLNRLLGYLTMQTRKRNLSLYYSIMDLNWIDSRLRWLTDIEIRCQDLFFSPWGKEKGLERGELIKWTPIDITGVISGKPGKQLLPRLLRAKPLWNCYDSFKPVDVWGGFTQIRVKSSQLVIDLRGEEEKESAAAQPKDEAAKAAEDKVSLLREFTTKILSEYAVYQLPRARELMKELRKLA